MLPPASVNCDDAAEHDLQILLGLEEREAGVGVQHAAEQHDRLERAHDLHGRDDDHRERELEQRGDLGVGRDEDEDERGHPDPRRELRVDAHHRAEPDRGERCARERGVAREAVGGSHRERPQGEAERLREVVLGQREREQRRQRRDRDDRGLPRARRRPPTCSASHAQPPIAIGPASVATGSAVSNVRRPSTVLTMATRYSKPAPSSWGRAEYRPTGRSVARYCWRRCWSISGWSADRPAAGAAHRRRCQSSRSSRSPRA